MKLQMICFYNLWKYILCLTEEILNLLFSAQSIKTKVKNILYFYSMTCTWDFNIFFNNAKILIIVGSN